jgi:hypothetical protein
MTCGANSFWAGGGDEAVARLQKARKEEERAARQRFHDRKKAETRPLQELKADLKAEMERIEQKYREEAKKLAGALF